MDKALTAGGSKVTQQAHVTQEEVSVAILLVEDAIADWNDIHNEALAEVLKEREGFGA